MNGYDLELGFNIWATPLPAPRPPACAGMRLTINGQRITFPTEGHRQIRTAIFVLDPKGNTFTLPMPAKINETLYQRYKDIIISSIISIVITIIFGYYFLY